MSYVKLNDVDFSSMVNGLAVNSNATYNSQTNAAGDTVVDYLGAKRTFTIGIIPLTNTKAVELLTAINGFNVRLSFLNPLTNELEENVECIIPSSNIEYYTIQAGKVMYKAFSLTFIEL